MKKSVDSPWSIARIPDSSTSRSDSPPGALCLVPGASMIDLSLTPRRFSDSFP